MCKRSFHSPFSFPLSFLPSFFLCLLFLTTPVDFHSLPFLCFTFPSHPIIPTCLLSPFSPDLKMSLPHFPLPFFVFPLYTLSSFFPRIYQSFVFPFNSLLCLISRFYPFFYITFLSVVIYLSFSFSNFRTIFFFHLYNLFFAASRPPTLYFLTFHPVYLFIYSFIFNTLSFSSG